MNESKISVRYAKSLFNLATERNVLDAVKVDIEAIYLIAHTVDEFSLLVHNPVIRPSQKKLIFSRIFAKNVQPVTLQFLLLVIQNNRESFLKDITRNFLDLYRSEKGIKKAEITTAIELDKKTISNIVSLIKRNFDTEVELTEHINEEIIGGYILRIEDQQIDASISHQLNKIKQSLVNKTYEAKIEI